MFLKILSSLVHPTISYTWAKFVYLSHVEMCLDCWRLHCLAGEFLSHGNWLSWTRRGEGVAVSGSNLELGKHYSLIFTFILN